MTRIGIGVFLLAVAPLAMAQMTERQKIADLESLASIYAKNYGPYDWKKAAFEFDLFDLRPWVERVKATRDDYEFFDVLMEYVAGLRDGHTRMLVPSSFSANLGFTVDIYDGRVLIDSIDRRALSLAGVYKIGAGNGGKCGEARGLPTMDLYVLTRSV